MRAPGLKTHIIVTILLLLGTATLLASLVIIMFWQQSLIRAEAGRIHSVLETTSAALLSAYQGDQEGVLVFLADVQEKSALECLATVSLTGEGITAATGRCRNKVQLSALMDKSVQSRSRLAETSGSTWGVFTLRPDFLLIALPHGPEQHQAGLGAVSSLKPLYHRVRQKQKTIIVYLLVNILLITTIGFFRLVKSTVKPVERLVRMTEEYDEKNEPVLFQAGDGNELGQLTSSLNRMIRRIDNDRQRLRDTVTSLEDANTRLQHAQEEMVRTEKLSSIGRLSAGLAHEIGNPIGIIQGYLELLQRKTLNEEDRLQFAQRAAGELNRINQLIRRLLDFARSSPSIQQPLHVNELLKDMLDLFRGRGKMDHITFSLDLQAQDDLIRTSEEGLRQVLLNCLLNAVDAIEELGAAHHGEITITTMDEPGDDQLHSLAITVRDNGCGIDPSLLSSIFDPFFTTKEPGKGTGLGLSVSYTIIESLGGRIAVQSEPGKGAEIKIILPRS